MVEQKHTNVKERLTHNRYQTDEEESHIRIDQDYAKKTGLGKILVKVCPAGVYTLNSDNSVSIEYAACLECGTCRAVADPKLLQWHYPRGGYGIKYRQG